MRATRNVGAGGFYGHRVLAAFSHLVDEEHVLFLDQDNFFAPDHVAQCIDLIAARHLQWCYSLRNICDEAGEFVCRDDCESLGKWPAFTGYHLIDTSLYCLRRDVLLQAAHLWHGKRGQDLIFAQVKRLSDLGDQLEAFGSAVDFEIFRGATPPSARAPCA